MATDSSGALLLVARSIHENELKVGHFHRVGIFDARNRYATRRMLDDSVFSMRACGSLVIALV